MWRPALKKEGTPLKKLKSALSQGGVSLLLACGLALPCLFALGIEGHWPLALGILAAMTAVCLAASLNKYTAVALPLGLALAAGAVFFPTVMEAGRAVVLKMAGQGAALPLYTLETTVILSVIIGLGAYPLCSRSAGFYPALTLCLSVLMALWLAGRPGADRPGGSVRPQPS